MKYNLIYNIWIKFSDRSTVKRHKTAICSRHRTVVCLDFESTALLRYGQYPYGTVYGTVESPNGDQKTVTKRQNMDIIWSDYIFKVAAMLLWILVSTANLTYPNGIGVRKEYLTNNN